MKQNLEKLDSDSLRNSFDADGFVIVRNLFDAAELSALKSEIDRYIKEVVPLLPRDAAFHDDYSKPETLRKMQSLDKHDAFFAEFMNSGKHVPLLEYFLRDGFSAQGLEWFDKLPYDTNATPAHQDGFYWCRQPNNACSLWIALDPVDRDNGCVWYARGSHKRGVQPHAASGVLGFSQGIVDFDPSECEAVPAELAPGDAVAHHAGTIHWTDVNRTDRHRRAIATFCFGASTVLDGAADARYKASLSAQLQKQGISPAAEPSVTKTG